jgi:hypothetical protein
MPNIIAEKETINMFKKGDKIKCLESSPGYFTKGKVYTVSNQDNEHGMVWVAKDDGDRWNGFWPEHFMLVNNKEKEMKVNYHVLNESVVLNYGGKTVTVAKGDNRYASVINAIREGKFDDIPALVETERSFFGSGFELRDGLLYEGETPFPSELSDRILKFREVNLPYAPLFKFWDNLKANPSYNARRMMFKFLEHNGHPLTDDGCFIAYRGVSQDLTDKHTGKFDNSPGSVCEMPRDAVDDNPNNTCSSGLHVACFDYAKDFGPRLVEVKVNPKDVVCVPTDYNGTKMRTCKFEVVQECENIRKELVYGDMNSVEEEDEKKEENGNCDNCDDECCGGDCYECDDSCDCGADRDSFANYCGNCGEEY